MFLVVLRFRFFVKSFFIKFCVLGCSLFSVFCKKFFRKFQGIMEENRGRQVNVNPEEIWTVVTINSYLHEKDDRGRLRVKTGDAKNDKFEESTVNNIFLFFFRKILSHFYPLIANIANIFFVFFRKIPIFSVFNENFNQKRLKLF